jgi:hypothetical protein
MKDMNTWITVLGDKQTPKGLTRTTRNPLWCNQCRKVTQNFRLADYVREAPLGSACFCRVCYRLVEKPQHFRGSGSTSSLVYVTYQEGSKESVEKKYCNGDPKSIIHTDCIGGLDMEMKQYARFISENGAIETHWECAICMQERVLKFLEKYLVNPIGKKRIVTNVVSEGKH